MEKLQSREGTGDIETVLKLKQFRLFSGHHYGFRIRSELCEFGLAVSENVSNYALILREQTLRPSLKKLAKEILSLPIQSGEHSSVSTCIYTQQFIITYR
ncbi:---NA--- [Paramuricea clavata]|uniref:---NA n=1 Tax=Paramuricea clavata TaxID=317549 RepID=A0A7D9HS72_PARCT|nr:---NA--- [Paramuricea clavata]